MKLECFLVAHYLTNEINQLRNQYKKICAFRGTAVRLEYLNEIKIKITVSKAHIIIPYLLKQITDIKKIIQAEENKILTVSFF